MRLTTSLRNGLVGAWCPSVSGWGGTILRDLSGQGNHGTLTNMDPATDWVVNDGKQALDFDGVDDRVSLGAPSLFDSILTSFTISAWCRPTGSFVNWRNVIAKGAGQAQFGIIVYSTGLWQAQINLASLNGGTLTLNKWDFLCYTYSPGALTTYMNGIRSGSSSGGNTAIIGNELCIGMDVTNNRRWLGQIDDVRIYNRVLSETEISLLASERGIGLRSTNSMQGRGKRIPPDPSVGCPLLGSGGLVS